AEGSRRERHEAALGAPSRRVRNELAAAGASQARRRKLRSEESCDEFPGSRRSYVVIAARERPEAEEEDEMSEHTIGTREEWQAAREELAKLEAEQAKQNEEIKRKRLGLPWVPVEKEYEFDTEDGKKTLGELFDGRSQLLAYNVMFGPEYTLGACPGCTSLADGLDG